MKLFIGVGGTGQHVALAIARMIRLGALPPMKAYIIDGDDNGALARELQTYAGVGDLPHPLGGASGFHAPFDKGQFQKNSTFRDLFLDGKSPGLERELFELFFDQPDERIEINEGMFGRPAIGAAVLAKSEEGTLEDLFKLIVNEDEVYIAGSFIGGTGAGVIHRLIGGLKRRKEGLRIYGAFYAPWFEATGKIGTAPGVMSSNMRHGFKYFGDFTLKQMKFALILGCSKQVQEDPVAKSRVGLAPTGADVAGKKTEAEIRHLFHLIAANGVWRLPEIAQKKSDFPDNRVFCYTLDPYNLTDLYKESWLSLDGPVTTPTLVHYYNRGVFLAAFYRWLTSEKMQNAIKAVFIGKFFGLSKLGASTQAITAELKDLIDRHAEGQKEKEKLIEGLQKNWKGRQKQLEYAYSWLENLLPIKSEEFPFVKDILDEEASKGGESASKRLLAFGGALRSNRIEADDRTRTDVNHLADRIEDCLNKAYWNDAPKV